MELEGREQKTDTCQGYTSVGESNNFEDLDRLHRLYQELYDEFVKSMKSEKFFSVQKDNQEQLGH